MTSLVDDQTTPPMIDESKDYYAELTGPGGKFYDPDENVAKRKLGRAKTESDLYVKSLTDRLDELREDYTKLREENNAVPRLQELIDQISAQRTTTSDLPPAERETQPAIGQAEIESLVSSKMQEFQNSQRQQTNFGKVQSTLEQKYGDNYKSIVKSKLQELGLSGDHIDALAKTSPQAALRLLGVEEQSRDGGFQPPVRSTLGSDNFSPTANKRTWNYYQKMRREQPDLYRNPKTQVEMHKDYEALGTAFEDGDFNH